MGYPFDREFSELECDDHLERIRKSFGSQDLPFLISFWPWWVGFVVILELRKLAFFFKNSTLSPFASIIRGQVHKLMP